MPNSVRELFDLQLDLVYLKAAEAAEQRAHGADLQRLEAIKANIEATRSKLAKARSSGGKMPDRTLAEQLSLTDDEVALVWTAVALQTDLNTLPHAIALVGPDARRGVSLLCFGVIWNRQESQLRALADALVPTHPLLRYGILHPTATDWTATATPLAVSHRVVAYLRGDDVIDSLVTAVGGRVTIPDPHRHDSDQQLALARLIEVVSSALPMVVVISGPLGSGRRTAAAVAANASGKQIIAIDAHRALSQARSLDAVLRALRRECALRSAIPLIAEVDECLSTERKDGAALGALLRFIDSSPGPVFLTTLEIGVPVDCASAILRVDWPVPDTETRKAMWQDALSSHTTDISDDLDGLALRYRFGAGGIRSAVQAAEIVVASRKQDRTVRAQDLVEGVRNNIAERLGGLAFRVAVKQSWDDLVLAPETLAQVRNVASRVKHAHLVFEQWGFRQKAARGIGVSVLFSGAPGTGKTMVAGLIARELDLELYQVDLSRVVSKWVGETEKNLAKVFEATDSGHALLLFDEADSLFSKRTEVKGAMDRHANLEVNYLLQRIESFGGVTILTTNMEASIDPALKRRLAGHVIFWPPEVDERIELWSRMLPDEAPVADGIDNEELAEKYSEMTGANIRNSVFAAAFLAAAEDSEITQEILHRAARGEYQTMGYVLT